MRLTDFCNCHHDTSTCSTGPTLEVKKDVIHALPARPLEPKPHRTSRVAALVDVAPPASASSTTRPSSSDEGVGAGCSWLASPIEGSLRRRPCTAAFSTAREEEERTSDAPCRGHRKAETYRLRQDRFRHLLVKRGGFHDPKRLPSTSCPLDARFRDRLERGPATGPWALPPTAGFRRSFALRS